MLDPNSAARNLELDPMEWTGRTEFDISDPRGWRVGTVEIVIRMDHLSLWLGNRTLAVIDRDAFRAWLVDPEGPFFVDDVGWSIGDTGAHLTIDDSVPYPIPDPLVQHLVQVI